MTKTQHAICLARTLKGVQLSHPVFNILTSIALQERERGFATIPYIALDISVTFNAVDQQLRKAGQYFTVDESFMPRRLNLTDEAIELLATINQKVNQFAAQRFGITDPSTVDLADPTLARPCVV